MWHLIDSTETDTLAHWSTGLAGELVSSNFRIAPTSTSAAGSIRGSMTSIDTNHPTCQRRTEAQIGGRMRIVDWGVDTTGQHISRFAHGLTLVVGEHTAQAEAATPEATADLREALLGPGLLLLEARRGAFALHASACADARGVVLFAGPSGFGKSSLARCAIEPIRTAAGPITRVADDIVLLSAEGQFRAPFPQLKLDAVLLPVPANTGIRRIIWPEFDDRLAAPKLVPLSPADMRLRLIRDSVAALLFPNEWLAAHLSFVTRLSQAVPGFVLRRPISSPIERDAANIQALDLAMA